ncbi:MAG TPA: metal-sulfur cluster assembly factor [Edaphocola sp.]|nr:metal-sulfur cluster assembly factor [Edaphocola sp.]
MNVASNDNIKCSIALSDLYNVMDPEIGLNVVDLGLIYKIDFDEPNKKIDLEMTLTTQFCPMGESITSNVNQSVSNSFPNWEVKVDLTFEPAWDFSMISPEGQEYLGH